MTQSGNKPTTPIPPVSQPTPAPQRPITPSREDYSGGRSGNDNLNTNVTQSVAPPPPPKGSNSGR
jgi:hypothetical protein